MAKKIIALDLDGTLLKDDKTISDENIKALEQVARDGNYIVIDTGRPIRAMKFLLDPYEVFKDENVYLIGFQGGLLYHPFKNKYYFNNYLEFEVVEFLFDLIMKYNVTALAFDEDRIYTYKEDKTLLRYNKFTNEPVQVITSIEELKTKKICKIMAIDYNDDKLLEKISDGIPKNLKVNSLFSSPWFLEFIDLEVSKGNGLQKAAMLLNIPLSNVVACGDERNDISMIKIAGVGVALINGNEDLKAVSDYVTKKDNNHGAIAEVIDKFF